MKLNPDDLAVSSFETSDRVIAGPIGTYDPTAMTFCYYCPPQTLNCEYTEPGTVIGTA